MDCLPDTPDGEPWARDSGKWLADNAALDACPEWVDLEPTPAPTAPDTVAPTHAPVTITDYPTAEPTSDPTPSPTTPEPTPTPTLPPIKVHPLSRNPTTQPPHWIIPVTPAPTDNGASAQGVIVAVCLAFFAMVMA